MIESSIEVRPQAATHAAGTVDFTVVVSPVTATGAVYYFINDTYVNSNGLTNGVIPTGSFTISPANTYVLTFVYMGDSNTAPSSTSFKYTVT
jgi:hypothetical protein